MTGTITGISKGPRYNTYFFKVGEKRGKTYSGATYRNYAKWHGLKEGDTIEGLRWKDETRGLLDADSPVRLAQVPLAL